jgi:hypothetical protein
MTAHRTVNAPANPGAPSLPVTLSATSKVG